MPQRVLLRLNAYAITHMVVDAACFFALFGGILRSGNAALMILLYDVLAFGLQPIFGLIADRMRDVRALSILGCGLTAFGAMLYFLPWVSLPLVGVGNALFHVGGAVGTLRGREGDALHAGWYVAPGALGVALGTLAGKTGAVGAPVFGGVLLVCILFIWLIGPGKGLCPEPDHRENVDSISLVPAIFCLLSIALRSFTGFAVDAPAGALTATLAIGIAAMGGKLFGGIGARLCSWKGLGVSMLLLSGIFLCIAPGSAFVYLGLFLFNMAMPLTLSTVILSFPGRTGFSFGLTTLALLIGVLPYTLIPREWAASPWYLAILVLLAALGLFFGLDPNRKKKQPLADPLAPSGQMPPIPAEPCAKPNWYETDASENKSADPSKKNSECHG